MFTALRLHKVDKELKVKIEDLSDADLPAGNTSLSVSYSSINYKDALAVTGKGKIIRGAFPFVPGIDLAGTILSSTNDAYPAGTKVIGTGWGLGENHWGGYSQQARVDHAWLVPLPSSMSLKHAMAIGTAGFTAMLSVMALQEHTISPEDGEVVVTGATGGVGSFAIALLAALGYETVASTGKADAHSYLKTLGATRIIDRTQLSAGAQSPLDSGKWAGAVDAVGSDTLAAILSQTKRHGAVAACGLAGGATLNTTVFPFILRGVNLLGIDSNTCPKERRLEAWQCLADTLSPSLLDQIMEVVSLTEVPACCDNLMAGGIQGRYVVDLNQS